MIHRQWGEEALKDNRTGRKAQWNEIVAVGVNCFVEQTQLNFGLRDRVERASQRQIVISLKNKLPNTRCVRLENTHLSYGNGLFWNLIG